MSRKANTFYAYVVPTQKEQGIVSSWAECENRVKGVSGARFKGFGTREEAERWLHMGAKYEITPAKIFAPGIYFDAGTGRGHGVEASVTDEKGKNLLHHALSPNALNQFGKHLVGSEVTNNFGELLAMKYALEIAKKMKVKNVFGDSKLVIDFWSKGWIKKNVAEGTIALAREVAKLRMEFEKSGGRVTHISGDDNPADLGFH
jgi:ribonuclease H-related protein